MEARLSTKPGRTKVGPKPQERWLGLTKAKKTGQDTLAFGLWSAHWRAPRDGTIGTQWAQGHGTALAKMLFKSFINSIKNCMCGRGYGQREREIVYQYII